MVNYRPQCLCAESAALSKEIEEGLTYRSMQSDIVGQIMRRLAAVRRRS